MRLYIRPSLCITGTEVLEIHSPKLTSFVHVQELPLACYHVDLTAWKLKGSTEVQRVHREKKVGTLW